MESIRQKPNTNDNFHMVKMSHIPASLKTILECVESGLVIGWSAMCGQLTNSVLSMNATTLIGGNVLWIYRNLFLLQCILRF